MPVLKNQPTPICPTQGTGWCVVLAASSAERFGGGKLAAPLAGRPLLAWAVRTALWSGLERVLVVLGPEAQALRPLLPADPRLEVLFNPRHREGMGTSLALAASRAGETGAAGLAVLLGGMPLVSPFVLAAVARAALEAPAGAAAACAGEKRGYPVAFSARHFPQLTRLGGNQGGRLLLDQLVSGLALVEAPPQSFLDVDRPADLARAAGILTQAQPRPGLAGLAVALGLEHPGLWGVVGSGGKTSLLYALAVELAGQGQAVTVTTTTHIYPPRAGQAAGPWLLGPDTPDPVELVRRLAQGSPLCLAIRRQADGKLTGLSLEQMAALSRVPGLWVLSEADGAAGRPLKGWALHEPALSGQEAGVIVVAGASGLERPLGALWVHRTSEFGQVAGLAQGQTITPQALARVLGGGHGPLRNLAEQVNCTLLINQAESLSPRLLRELGTALAQQERWRAVLCASLRLGWWHVWGERL
ncbi:molybdenum cofactor cytidylyltransferase [Desulfarculales bacterium]